jgi:hypothetical protein
MPRSQQVSLRKPWRTFLVEVDEALRHEITLHCLGGFVLAALYDLPRPTGDIDYILIDPGGAQDELFQIGGRGSPLCKKHKVYFQRVGVAEYPYEYEDRLILLDLDLHKLKLFVLEPYDLILSKLCRDGPKDSDDAQYLAKKLNLSFDVLYKRWLSEMKPSVPHPDRHETTIQLWKEYFPLS